MYPQMTPGYRGLRPAKASIASRGYLGLFGAVLGLFGGVSTGGAPEGHLGVHWPHTPQMGVYWPHTPIWGSGGYLGMYPR